MHVLQNFLNLKEPPSQGDWAQTGETFNYVFILRQHSGSHGDWAQTGETFNYVFILRQHSFWYLLVSLRLLQFMGSIC